MATPEKIVAVESFHPDGGLARIGLYVKGTAEPIGIVSRYARSDNEFRAIAARIVRGYNHTTNHNEED